MLFPTPLNISALVPQKSSLDAGFCFWINNVLFQKKKNDMLVTTSGTTLPHSNLTMAHRGLAHCGILLLASLLHFVIFAFKKSYLDRVRSPFCSGLPIASGPLCRDVTTMTCGTCGLHLPMEPRPYQSGSIGNTHPGCSAAWLPTSIR